MSLKLKYVWWGNLLALTALSTQGLLWCLTARLRAAPDSGRLELYELLLALTKPTWLLCLRLVATSCSLLIRSWIDIVWQSREAFGLQAAH